MQDGAGIKSYTIAKLQLMLSPDLVGTLKHHVKQIGRAALGKPTYKLNPLEFDRRTVLVLDEAAMISTRELADLTAKIERAGGMLITVFDRRQLQAIGNGGAAAFLADRHGKAELNQIVRQRSETDVDIVKAFASGKSTDALAKMKEQGNVHIAKSKDAALTKLIADWSVNEQGRRGESLIFVGTRAEALEANKRCQAARLRDKEIAERGISLGSYSVHQGDRVMFTKNSKPMDVQNGTLGTVVGLKRFSGIASVRLDSGKVVAVPLKSYGHLQLGYAVTTHKGQGTTVNNAYLLVGGGMQNQEMSYVQASRARHSTRLYSSRQEAGKKLAQLAKQMAKSEQKTLAHEVLAKQQKKNHQKIEQKISIRI
jgi:ATP-dependent exoDNAse (exonuclease V) alpha subunit